MVERSPLGCSIAKEGPTTERICGVLSSETSCRRPEGVVRPVSSVRPIQKQQWGDTVAHLTKAQLAEAIQAIYSGYIEGLTDEEQAAKMGLEAEEFQRLRTAMFDSKAEEVRAKPTEHVYVQYIIDQAKNIKDLTEMINDFKNTRQHTAMVAAVKARSDIHDKLIKKGQEFGFIRQDPKTGDLGLGKLLGDMSNKQLRVAITAELRTLNDLVGRYGDGNILDVSVGQLHHGPRLPAQELEDDRLKMVDSAPPPHPQKKPSKKAKAKKTARSKNNKRHAGRVKARAPGPRAET